MKLRTEEIENERKAKFMSLYNPLHERLVRFVQTIVWDKEEARDIVSETILAAYEHFEKVKHHEAFLYYLFTIAKRKMNRRYVQQKRQSPWTDELNDKAEDQSPDALRQLQVKELKQAIAHLPEKYREPLVLFEFSGLTIKEIAELTQLTENGVKSRLVRARQQLSEILDGSLHEKAI